MADVSTRSEIVPAQAVRFRSRHIVWVARRHYHVAILAGVASFPTAA